MSRCRMTPTDRFWSKVNRSGGPDACWLWMGHRHPRGYGRLTVRHREDLAHRVSYESLVGPVPAGLELDHLCCNPPCVNPAHLEPVTHAENVRRAAANGAWLQERCSRGHDDLRWVNGLATPRRRCLTCRRNSNREWTRAKRAQTRSVA